MATPAPDHERLAAAFRRFGEFEAVENHSPLYARLSEAVAGDRELLALASNASPGQPAPNMLFAAVQYLLAQSPEEQLAAAYPAFANGRPAPSPLPVLFAEFCQRRADDLVPLLQSRLVQTNEVRRSACLLPAFASVYASTGKPLALFEIGPSAGVNLLFDRYCYRYGGGHTVGDPSSPAQIDSDWRGDIPPPDELPAVVSRLGIDLNPLDVRDDDDVRWLQALIWPEHDDRRRLLNNAISVAREHPPRLLGGDLFELLPPELESVSPEAATCIFATFVLNQFSNEMNGRFDALLRDCAKARPLSLVIMGSAAALTGERDETAVTSVWLLSYSDGERRVKRLARCNPHGRWIAWEAEA